MVCEVFYSRKIIWGIETISQIDTGISLMEKQEYLSQSKYAEHWNATKGYIGKLIKEGRLHLIKGKLNVAMSGAELENKSNDDKALIR